MELNQIEARLRVIQNMIETQFAMQLAVAPAEQSKAFRAGFVQQMVDQAVMDKCTAADIALQKQVATKILKSIEIREGLARIGAAAHQSNP